MTRVVGTRIYRTPCCGRHYGGAAYGSINFMAWEHWTDGASVGSLAPDPGWIYRCECGHPFLMGNTETVGVIRRQRHHPRLAAEDSGFAGWWRKFFGIKRPAEVRAALPGELDPQTPEPASAPIVGRDELPTLIQQCQDEEFLIVARRAWWQHLNEPYKERYRALRQDGQGPVPPFKPSAEQLENMQALRELILRRDGRPSIELAELHRQLGQPDASRAVLAAVGQPDLSIVKVIGDCLDEGLSGPVRYRP